MFNLNVKIPIQTKNDLVNEYFFASHDAIKISENIINQISTFSSILRLNTKYPKNVFDKNKTNIILNFTIVLHSGSIIEDNNILERELESLLYKLTVKTNTITSLYKL